MSQNYPHYQKPQGEARWGRAGPAPGIQRSLSGGRLTVPQGGKAAVSNIKGRKEPVS